MATPLSDTPAYGLGIYSLPDPCPTLDSPTPDGSTPDGSTPDGSAPVLLGHDGGSFGTVSVSLSSPDARRQVTIAYTGRNFVDPAKVPITEFLGTALLSTCSASPATDGSRTLRPPRFDRWSPLG